VPPSIKLRILCKYVRRRERRDILQECPFVCRVKLYCLLVSFQFLCLCLRVDKSIVHDLMLKAIYLVFINLMQQSVKSFRFRNVAISEDTYHVLECHLSAEKLNCFLV
jgi:hypothetical protein